MSGDYSRIRFDPRTDIASVWMQQGRVQLDSDWNEGMAALDRRLRAESVDTFGVQPVPGMTGVAVVSPQTPDAFKIEAAGGNMTIGRGRMYVDGLLAENHGGGAVEFDAVLAELRGQTALAYDQQPYFSAPPALPSGGPHLAYLEVWSRELTYLQRPEIVENAVGVDTTTRWQTVWQVRLLGNIGSVDCTTPDAQFPAWQ
ncbi:MAG: right-handed parallel beta-helix repeat-containing protein, partial [Candidatus Competibacteraceae bacterium]|nr:right-handed parallel beta-helix repeat-containing protein [Candidatus Competibacteraceae bacterium]